MDNQSNEDKGEYLHNLGLSIDGLGIQTSKENLRDYFKRYGEIENIKVYMDQRDPTISSGSAYIVFCSAEAIREVLKAGTHMIDNRVIHVEQAPARNLRIFVGGLTNELSYEDIKSYFLQFDSFVLIKIPFDAIKQEKKPYCFVDFDSDDIVEKVLKTPTIFIKNVELQVSRTQFSKNYQPNLRYLNSSRHSRRTRVQNFRLNYFPLSVQNVINTDPTTDKKTTSENLTGIRERIGKQRRFISAQHTRWRNNKHFNSRQQSTQAPVQNFTPSCSPPFSLRENLEDLNLYENYDLNQPQPYRRVFNIDPTDEETTARTWKDSVAYKNTNFTSCRPYRLPCTGLPSSEKSAYKHLKEEITRKTAELCLTDRTERIEGQERTTTTQYSRFSQQSRQAPVQNFKPSGSPLFAQNASRENLEDSNLYENCDLGLPQPSRRVSNTDCPTDKETTAETWENSAAYNNAGFNPDEQYIIPYFDLPKTQNNTSGGGQNYRPIESPLYALNFDREHYAFPQSPPYGYVSNTDCTTDKETTAETWENSAAYNNAGFNPDEQYIIPYFDLPKTENNTSGGGQNYRPFDSPLYALNYAREHYAYPKFRPYGCVPNTDCTADDEKSDEETTSVNREDSNWYKTTDFGLPHTYGLSNTDCTHAEWTVNNPRRLTGRRRRIGRKKRSTRTQHSSQKNNSSTDSTDSKELE